MTTYIDVFVRLTRQMNGAVSQTMRELGGDQGMKYKMNYGVSLPTIKDIALEYYPNHALAEDLWRQEVREMQLAAVYIDQPEEITFEQIDKHSQKWEHIEIGQVAAMHLLWKTPIALQIAQKWFNSPNRAQHIASCHIIGKIAPTTQSADLLQFITPEANAYAMREVYKYHTELRAQIKCIAPKIEDLEWQLE